jgi:hypothetical protein
MVKSRERNGYYEYLKFRGRSGFPDGLWKSFVALRHPARHRQSTKHRCVLENKAAEATPRAIPRHLYRKLSNFKLELKERLGLTMVVVYPDKARFFLARAWQRQPHDPTSRRLKRPI